MFTSTFYSVRQFKYDGGYTKSEWIIGAGVECKPQIDLGSRCLDNGICLQSNNLQDMSGIIHDA